MAAVGCAYKAQLGVLWRVGATVIVHSCVHNEDQPWAGFISCSAFSARLFFFFFPPHFWQYFLPLKTRKGAQGAFQLLSGAGGEALLSGERHWALIDSSLTIGKPQLEVRQDLHEVHICCPRTAKTEKFSYGYSGSHE